MARKLIEGEVHDPFTRRKTQPKIAQVKQYCLPFLFAFYMLLAPWSLKSVLVLPPQIFGPFGPPKKRVNFNKINQRHKCVVFCPPSVQ